MDGSGGVNTIKKKLPIPTAQFEYRNSIFVYLVRLVSLRWPISLISQSPFIYRPPSLPYIIFDGMEKLNVFLTKNNALVYLVVNRPTRIYINFHISIFLYSYNNQPMWAGHQRLRPAACISNQRKTQARE